MKNEKELMQQEWLQYSKDDLGSAEILLKQTNYYEISVYHSHQSMEKAFKWFLLKKDIKFPFVHDLKELCRRVGDLVPIDDILLRQIIFVDNLYPQLRYPSGDKISKEQAEEALNAAKAVSKLLVDQ